MPPLKILSKIDDIADTEQLNSDILKTRIKWIDNQYPYGCVWYGRAALRFPFISAGNTDNMSIIVGSGISLWALMSVCLSVENIYNYNLKPNNTTV